MAADASKYGITQPLDEAPPHDGDEDSSAAFVTVSTALGVYESQEGSRRRASLIDDVAAECQHWCREDGSCRGMIMTLT